MDSVLSADWRRPARRGKDTDVYPGGQDREPETRLLPVPRLWALSARSTYNHRRLSIHLCHNAHCLWRCCLSFFATSFSHTRRPEAIMSLNSTIWRRIERGRTTGIWLALLSIEGSRQQWRSSRQARFKTRRGKATSSTDQGGRLSPRF